MKEIDNVELTDLVRVNDRLGDVSLVVLEFEIVRMPDGEEDTDAVPLLL